MVDGGVGVTESVCVLIALWEVNHFSRLSY